MFMFGKALRKKLTSLAITLVLVLASTTTAFGQGGSPGCGPAGYGPANHQGKPGREKCHWLCCPPPLKHCMERPPRLCFWPSCPKPTCSPCEAPNWGYYPTCWTPWPWPPDWSHCPMPPPAAFIPQGGPAVHEVGARDVDAEGPWPAPRQIQPRP